MDLSAVRSDLRGFSLRSLSMESGLSRQSIKAIREGTTLNPGVETITRLTDAVKSLAKKKNSKKADVSKRKSRKLAEQGTGQ